MADAGDDRAPKPPDPDLKWGGQYEYDGHTLTEQVFQSSGGQSFSLIQKHGASKRKAPAVPSRRSQRTAKKPEQQQSLGSLLSEQSLLVEQLEAAIVASPGPLLPEQSLLLEAAIAASPHIGLDITHRDAKNPEEVVRTTAAGKHLRYRREHEMRELVNQEGNLTIYEDHRPDSLKTATDESQEVDSPAPRRSPRLAQAPPEPAEQQPPHSTFDLSTGAFVDGPLAALTKGRKVPGLELLAAEQQPRLAQAPVQDQVDRSTFDMITAKFVNGPLAGKDMQEVNEAHHDEVRKCKQVLQDDPAVFTREKLHVARAVYCYCYIHKLNSRYTWATNEDIRSLDTFQLSCRDCLDMIRHYMDQQDQHDIKYPDDTDTIKFTSVALLVDALGKKKIIQLRRRRWKMSTQRVSQKTTCGMRWQRFKSRQCLNCYQMSSWQSMTSSPNYRTW